MRAALMCAALISGGAVLAAASDWALYRASIAAADGALRLHETSAALSWLEAAPAAERGWEWQYLRALADQSRLAVRAHDTAVTGVAVSADGRIVATTSTDKTVRLWDAATGAARVSLSGATATTWSPALRRRASHVAAVSSDGTLRVWDYGSAATAAAPIAVFERIGRGLGATAWSPDGSLLAAATWTVEAGRGVQGWVHLWRFDDRQLLWKVPYGVKPIAALAFSPDGRQLVAGTWDGRLGWFAAPGNGALAHDVEIAAIDGGYTAVQSVAYGADGGELIVGTKDGRARVFTTADGRLLRTYAGHARWVNGVARLPTWDVTASTDETLRLWTAGSTRPHRVLHGHRAAISGVAALPDGGLVSADADGMLRWWDAGVADVSRVVWRGTDGETGVYGIAFTPDGTRAATAAWGGAVTLRDAGTGRAIWAKATHKTSANAVAFHPGGTHIVSGGSDGRLAVVGIDGAAGLSWNSGAGRQVDSVAWSADGRLIASPSAPPTATVWDAATGMPVRTVPARTGTMTAVAFGLDGRFVAAVASSGDVTLARADAGEPVTVAAAHPGGAHAVSFSPDGTVLATAGSDRRIRLWRVPDLTPLRELRGHAEQVTGLAFSPDGLRLASSSNDQTVRLWSPATGELVLTIPFEEQVYGVRFTPDGRRLAVLPLDGTVRLLEAPSYH